MPKEILKDNDLDAQIERVASLMFAAALGFTNSIGRHGWSWDLCDEKSKNYWRNIARLSREVFVGNDAGAP
jgi:hypothetical protein